MPSLIVAWGIAAGAATVLAYFAVRDRRSGATRQRSPRGNVLMDTFVLWAHVRYGQHEPLPAASTPEPMNHDISQGLAALNLVVNMDAGVRPEAPTGAYDEDAAEQRLVR